MVNFISQESIQPRGQIGGGGDENMPQPRELSALQVWKKTYANRQNTHVCSARSHDQLVTNHCFVTALGDAQGPLMYLQCKAVCARFRQLEQMTWRNSLSRARKVWRSGFEWRATHATSHFLILGKPSHVSHERQRARCASGKGFWHQPAMP